MSNKPIFVATHPRACSTAFERVFMTCRDTLQCVHEPFGDAFYFGPERLSDRYENDDKARLESGFSESTFKTIFDRIDRENTEGKRLFIKDMVYYLVPPNGKPVSIAPSLLDYKRGVGTESPSSTGSPTSTTPSDEVDSTETDSVTTANGETSSAYPYATAAERGNPTVVPEALLKQFHFAFLIRHPKYSTPSFYRCTIPPLDEMTDFYKFKPSEAGYDELRRVFDYLRSVGQVGPEVAGSSHTHGDTESRSGAAKICVIDADDLLDSPGKIIEAFCKSVGIEYTPDMLKWDNDEDHRVAKEAFEKWKGFHEDAIHSTELKAREHKKKPKTDEELYDEWVQKYGEKGAKIIKETVAKNVADYEYLKQFAIKV